MAHNRLWAGLMCAVVATGLGTEAAAQTAAQAGTTVATEPRFGIVRVRIDRGVGEQEAEIRQMLARHAFVQIGEPADYLVTTQPDFPLDLSVVDLRHPREHWRALDEQNQEAVSEPRTFRLGNLREAGTAQRLDNVLLAASRVRALLDRSVQRTLGVESCVVVREDRPYDCRLLGEPGTNFGSWGTKVRVRNISNADRWVATLAADGSLRIATLGKENEPDVRKLGPGDALEIPAAAAGFRNYDDPRVVILSSLHPFTLDPLTQPAPLESVGECKQDHPTDACARPASGISLSDDLAVRSVQLIIPPEPEPAMGHGTDVTASMAVWMAQFYSVIPYTDAEIDADAKLPEDKQQFLKWRTHEELQHRCGGALIAPDVVLTAAHCVAAGQYAGDGLVKVLKERRVRLGTRGLGKGGQSFAIASVAVHTGYVDGEQNHDLALLLLRPDRGSGTIRQRPIVVAGRPLPGGTNALAFGWGLTGAVAPNGNIMFSSDRQMQNNAEMLQYGEMISVTYDQCRRKFPGPVAPGMVCMYSKAALDGSRSRDGVFTCRGDSGGPLVRKVGGRDVLVGVVSWSLGCGHKNYPSVFTDAGSYAQWIAAARAALKPGLVIRTADPARPTAGSRRN
jgi:hypothetical protein